MGFQGNAWISLLSVSLQNNLTLLENVLWQKLDGDKLGTFPLKEKRKYKNGEEKHLWQEGLIKTTWRACSMPFYKWMALQCICLLNTSTMGHAAQVHRQQDEERQTLEDCHVQKYGRARKSPSDKPEPRCDLITTFFESTDKKKPQWAHAAMIKNVLRLSEAFRFKLSFWKKMLAAE